MASRLGAIKAFISQSDLVVDVGSDHGLLAIMLISEGMAKRVINVDKRAKPLAAGIANAKKAGYASQITSILSDGFASYDGPSSVDAIVMAGFGGKEMAKVLNNVPVQWKRMVLQPSADAPVVRKTLQQKGWGMADETVVFENGRHYEIMAVEKSGTQLIEETDVLFGPHNKKRKAQEFVTMWSERLALHQKNYNSGKRAGLKTLITAIKKELGEEEHSPL